MWNLKKQNTWTGEKQRHKQTNKPQSLKCRKQISGCQSGGGWVDGRNRQGDWVPYGEEHWVMYGIDELLYCTLETHDNFNDTSIHN